MRALPRPTSDWCCAFATLRTTDSGISTLKAGCPLH
jgi:hypothetical protein